MQCIVDAVLISCKQN